MEEEKTELNKYDQLSQLDVSTYDWKCRVRAQAVWKGMNRDTQEFWGLNMLFIDDCNTRIHAYANAKFCSEIEKGLVEGQVYILSNFKVKDFVGDETFRPVRNKKHIFFTKDTKLKQDKAQGLKIERYAFDLFHMMEIEKLAKDNRFLVDMAGFMKNRRPIITSNKNNVDKHRLKFDLVDGRDSVPVTFFDDFALELDKALPANEDEDVVLIISSAKVNRYDGSAQLSNYPATRVYINPDHYCVNNLRNREDEMSDFSDIEEDQVKPSMTLKEITTLNEEFLAREVCCEVVVNKVHIDQKWYVTSCTKCPNEVKFEEEKFKCENCKRIIPHPRRSFQLQTLCSDRTASVTIVLPHSEVSRISQKMVEDLYCPDKEELGEHCFPHELLFFQRQKYNITIKLNEENVRQASHIYEATEVAEIVESFGTFTPNQESIVENDLSVMKPMETEDIAAQTPRTSRSINTKIRVRKNPQPVPFDQNDETGTTIKPDRKKKAK